MPQNPAAYGLYLVTSRTNLQLVRMKYLLEVCAGDIDSVYAALHGGAGRVELCSGLEEGGLTPSYGFIKEACGIEGLGKHVLIRPRGGDFLYSEREKRLMYVDIRKALEAGADGVVIGALKADGQIDSDFTRACVAEAEGRSVTFHRAFDLCADPVSSLERLIDAGCDRLLTSGQAATAETGLPLLRELTARAGDRLSVMPGCGVNAGNAWNILRGCGAREIHASARKPVTSLMRHRIAGVEMGQAGRDEYTRLTTSEEAVREIVESFHE